MVRFRCMHCRFNYSPKSGRAEPPVVCGNCGKTGTLRVEPDADSLLRDADKM